MEQTNISVRIAISSDTMTLCKDTWIQAFTHTDFINIHGFSQNTND